MSDTKGIASNSCVEHGVWTPVPIMPKLALNFKVIDSKENDKIKTSGSMSFHTVGCTGNYSDHVAQRQVAAAMASQINLKTGKIKKEGEVSPSFFYHLGDIAYKDEDDTDPKRSMQSLIYNTQFYQPYANYPRSIFAIAGNHDGKYSQNPDKSPIDHFLSNFCSSSRGVSPDNTTDKRPTMTQPHLYWRLDTPLATIIGLYTNVANGGILDYPYPIHEADPGFQEKHFRPQYHWLVAQLKEIGALNSVKGSRKAILIALHYPPYSATSNFAQRGDTTVGPTGVKDAPAPAAFLAQAFEESGVRPDLILCAHTHLYQRLTYTFADGYQIPYVVAGSGGHSVDRIIEKCDGSLDSTVPKTPCACPPPPNYAIPAGNRLTLEAYNDTDFGFCKITLTKGTISGQFFKAVNSQPILGDAFLLDLQTHKLK